MSDYLVLFQETTFRQVTQAAKFVTIGLFKIWWYLTGDLTWFLDWHKQYFKLKTQTYSKFWANNCSFRYLCGIRFPIIKKNLAENRKQVETRMLILTMFFQCLGDDNLANNCSGLKLLKIPFFSRSGEEEEFSRKNFCRTL